MKHCYSFLFLLASLNIHAQEMQLENDSLFSITLELKKPNEKGEGTFHFLLRLYNKLDRAVYLTPGRDGRHSMQTNSFLYGQYITKSGEFITSDVGRTCLIFSYEDSSVYKVPARSFCSVKVPIMIEQVDTTETGLLPSRGTGKYAKVRVMLKDFVAIDSEIKRIYKFDLYSNWVDISGEDFSLVEK